MSAIHQTLAAGRWQTMTLAEQLGNIGSEFARFASGRKTGDKGGSDRSAERCLELMDLTIADPRWRLRLSELTRLREVFCDISSDNPQYAVSVESLQDYFLPFAIAARRKV